MNKDQGESDVESRTRQLLASGAAAELTFLKQERKAELRLAAARATVADDARRLRKAQERLDQGREAVKDAEAALLECQRRRAVGPAPPPG